MIDNTQIKQTENNKPLNIGFLVSIDKFINVGEFGFKSIDYKIINKLRVKQ